MQKETSAENYEKEFKDNFRQVISEDICAIVFGDIHLQHCLAWANKVCHDIGVVAIEPLWGKDPERSPLDFIESGFEAIVVSTQANLLGQEWIGRKLDASFLSRYKKVEEYRSVWKKTANIILWLLMDHYSSERIEIRESEKFSAAAIGFWILQNTD